MNTIQQELQELDIETTNAELYRLLEGLGLGDREMFKSRYKRNTDGFRDLLSEWRQDETESYGDNVESSDWSDTVDDQEWYEVDRFTQSDIKPINDITTEQYLRQQAKLFKAHMDSHSQGRQQVKFKVAGQWTALMTFADVHMEDHGANTELLFNTIEKFNAFGPMRYADLGDLGNFFGIQDWSTRIVAQQKYTNADTYDSAKRLFKLMGQRKLVSVVGNHDEWITKTLGFDPIKELANNFAPNSLYRPFEAIIQLGSESGWTEKILLSHSFKGRAMWNPHHATIKSLTFNYPIDVNFAISGHFHFNRTSLATFPFETRFIKSGLLGTIKSGDDYSQSLGYASNQNTEPFIFIFQTPTGQKEFTNIQHALDECERLTNLYG